MQDRHHCRLMYPLLLISTLLASRSYYKVYVHTYLFKSRLSSILWYHCSTGTYGEAVPFVGNHSAVAGGPKTCSRKRVDAINSCFTGFVVTSAQMTTSMFCANRCTFCWRGDKAPVSRDWYGPIDEPSVIINEATQAHLKLLCGYSGHPKVNKAMIEKYKDVKHVALSLTGEPITYPLIDEILSEFHKRRVSTFLVTNAQYPEALRKIRIVRNYISVDTEQSWLKMWTDPCPDYYSGYWMSRSWGTVQTCIRLTIVKGGTIRPWRLRKLLLVHQTLLKWKYARGASRDLH